jgi:acyl-CoA synthetase (AMP-forming)/AMP-acid ligase II
MLPGLMQQTPLLISSIVRYAAAAHGTREIVSRQIDGPIFRYDYAGLARRAEQAAKALQALGVRPGDRVSSLAWNTHRHLELFFAVPGFGAVLHTANPRLFDDQIVYTINHAESRVLLFEKNLLALVERLAPQLSTVKTFVMLTDQTQGEPGAVDALCYETLLAAEAPGLDWPSFDENAAAVLCYTSGTTGDPKGVLYSHRAIVLHAMGAGLAAAFGFTAFDVVMPCSSLYHATAWGLPFVAPICGSKLVLPGERMDGASLHELIEAEGVTFSGGVPTIWTLYLAWLEQAGKTAGTLKRVVIGGSAVPESLVRAFRDDYGVDVTHAWGMTETSPLGTLSVPSPEVAAMPAEQQLRYKLKQGRPPAGVELKLTDDAGKRQPYDGSTYGRLKVRGAAIAGAYFKGEGGDILDEEGFFDTGDVATIDALGYMQITDRAKDVIKSGGEWISTIEIENLAAGHPKALIAAVIGVAHPKWDERPLLLVKLKDGESATREEFLQYLDGKIARWWTPDDVVFVDDIPLGATGKIDKKLIRQRFADYVLPTAKASVA